MSAVAVAVALSRTGDPLDDPDVWWHVRTGRLILDTGAIPHSDPFSFTAPHGTWVLTAWLSDLLFGGIWRISGYDGIRVLRVLMAVAVVAAVWILARRCSGNERTAWVVTGLIALGVRPFLAERPQVLSYLFVAALAWQLERILRGKRPSIWLLPSMTWLWANVHGMWVIAPLLVLVAGVLAWTADRERVPLAARCTVLSGLCLAAAGLTPVGPRLVVWPLVVSHVAAPISEWQPTLPLGIIGAPFMVLMTLLVASWARAREAAPRERLLFAAVVVLFALAATRNVAPAMILLLPETMRAVTVAATPRPETILPRTRRALPVTAVTVGLVVAALHLITTPAVSHAEPERIAAWIRASPRDLRLLNGYDVGGFLTGEATPQARVAIDGRTDMWSAGYVQNYLRDTGGGSGWRDLVDRLRPDVAVLRDDSEVVRGLVAERHWRIVMTDRHWTLLTPP